MGSRQHQHPQRDPEEGAEGRQEVEALHGGKITSATSRERSIGIKFKPKFNKKGTYNFVCTIHPTTMKVKVVVKVSSGARESEMSLPPIGRRAFVAEAAGGLLLCTLAGKQFSIDEEVPVETLNEGLEVPPKVAAARANGGVAARRRDRPGAKARDGRTSTGSRPSR